MLERAESVIAEAEAGARFYQLAAMYAFRGLVRLARGDGGGAESDAELTVELARPVRDPQALHPGNPERQEPRPTLLRRERRPCCLRPGSRSTQAL